MSLRQQREHLLDLNNLFRRAAKKAQQRFPEGLTQNSEPAKRHDAAGEMGIAPPRQHIRERGEIAIRREVARERFFRDNDGVQGRAPFESLGRATPESHNRVCPEAKPNSFIAAIPAERLSTVQNLGEYF